MVVSFGKPAVMAHIPCCRRQRAPRFALYTTLTFRHHISPYILLGFLLTYHPTELQRAIRFKKLYLWLVVGS